MQATAAETDNSMKSRTEGCIALLSTGSTTGSVRLLHLASNRIITRDQFKVIPMPDLVVQYLTAKAIHEGFTRGATDPGVPSQNEVEYPLLPTVHPIDHPIQPQNIIDDADAGGVYNGPVADEVLNGQVTDEVLNGQVIEEVNDGPAANEDLNAPLEVIADATNTGGVAQPVEVPTQQNDEFQAPPRYATRYATGSIPSRGVAPPKLDLLVHEQNEASRQEIRRQLALRSQWRDTDFAFTISVRMALKNRGEEARPVIMAELQQMVDKHVWHGVHLKNLTRLERQRIIRSSMFLKDKFLASGAFDRFKARLVAGGDMQDKSLYENLSSPTASTTSVLTVAAIAASEGRHVITIDIGGAFLNADMAPTGIKVHMRLDRVMTSLLQQIDPGYKEFEEHSGTVVVELDKALYGCVEAAALWYNDLRGTLESDGFSENPYDVCVFNKQCSDGSQTTIVLHVDDLLVSNKHEYNLSAFYNHLKSNYKETRIVRGKVLDYVGMSFDFSVPGKVKVTMNNCVNDILGECGDLRVAATPASSFLFDVRDTVKASTEEQQWFHRNTAKVLYLAKRVRPECLTAVAFLSTRVTECDQDDLLKLKRLLGYIKGTRDRGIMLCIGDNLQVRAYIDAAYGVHQESGKSHTGCVLVLGDGGPLYNKSAKQKIVTKSSTEAELVGLSDTASQAIHLRNFVIAQGYEVGPAIVYQDNMSCMALMKRGGPGSDRSRHINIRHFWLCEKVADGEVIIEHLGTEHMVANLLTKPVQGAQFVRERRGLTNWE